MIFARPLSAPLVGLKFGGYPLARIDHVFVDPGINVASIEVPSTELTRVASDHLPLIVEIYIPRR